MPASPIADMQIEAVRKLAFTRPFQSVISNKRNGVRFDVPVTNILHVDNGWAILRKMLCKIKYDALKRVFKIAALPAKTNLCESLSMFRVVACDVGLRVENDGKRGHLGSVKETCESSGRTTGHDYPACSSGGFYPFNYPREYVLQSKMQIARIPRNINVRGQIITWIIKGDDRAVYSFCDPQPREERGQILRTSLCGTAKNNKQRARDFGAKIEINNRLINSDRVHAKLKRVCCKKFIDALISGDARAPSLIARFDHLLPFIRNGMAYPHAAVQASKAGSYIFRLTYVHSMGSGRKEELLQPGGA